MPRYVAKTTQSGGLSIDLDALDVKGLLKVIEKFKDYQHALEKQSLSGHTSRAYQTRLQHFLGFLGERLYEYPDALTSPLTRDRITCDFKQHLKGKLKSGPQTINAYLTAIDSFYLFLGLGKAKTDREELPQLPPQILTDQEQQDFIRAIARCQSLRDRALATLLLNTGLRISECAALNESDIFIRKRKHILKVRSEKDDSYRDIPLNSSSLTAIKKWLAERYRRYQNNFSPALFLSNRGGRLSVDSIDHAIRKLAIDAKLDGMSAHTLRHTCFANLIRQGKDVASIAQIGGHKKLETTNRYQLLFADIKNWTDVERPVLASSIVDTEEV